MINNLFHKPWQDLFCQNYLQHVQTNVLNSKTFTESSMNHFVLGYLTHFCCFSSLPISSTHQSTTVRNHCFSYEFLPPIDSCNVARSDVSLPHAKKELIYSTRYSTHRYSLCFCMLIYLFQFQSVHRTVTVCELFLFCSSDKPKIYEASVGQIMLR